MAFPNQQYTTIVPDGDPETILRDSSTIKMIVLGSRPELALKAEHLASDAPFVERRVIWFTDDLPSWYVSEFNIRDISMVKAFSLSTLNQVGLIITIDDLEDYNTIETAYNQAGLISP